MLNQLLVSELVTSWCLTDSGSGRCPSSSRGSVQLPVRALDVAAERRLFAGGRSRGDTTTMQGLGEGKR